MSHHVYHGIAWCTYAPSDAHTNKLLATIMNGINIAGLVFGSKRDQYFQFSNYTFLYTILLLTHFSCPKNVSVSQWRWNGNMIAGGWRERLRSSRLSTRSICVRTSRIGKAKASPPWFHRPWCKCCYYDHCCKCHKVCFFLTISLFSGTRVIVLLFCCLTCYIPSLLHTRDVCHMFFCTLFSTMS